MKSRMICVLASGTCFAMLGCAGEPGRFTGLLRDYSILKPHPTIDERHGYWNRRVDPEHLTDVLVESVEVHFKDYSEESRTNPEEVTEFRDLVNEELTAAIGKHLAITTEPGPNVTRSRLQVANLQRAQSKDETRPFWPPRDYVFGTADVVADAHDTLSSAFVMTYVSQKGGVERHVTSFLTRPPDCWEATKTAIRSYLVVWTDDAFQRVRPESIGIEPPYR